MDELQLDGKFSDVAIAMAIGDKQMLKHKGTDPNGIKFSQGTRPKWVTNNMDGT